MDELSQKQVVGLWNIHKTFLVGDNALPALRGINLSIKNGEFIGIYGSSGSGKSTLLNIIGLIDPQR